MLWFQISWREIDNIQRNNLVNLFSRFIHLCISCFNGLHWNYNNNVSPKSFGLRLYNANNINLACIVDSVGIYYLHALWQIFIVLSCVFLQFHTDNSNTCSILSTRNHSLVSILRYVRIHWFASVAQSNNNYICVNFDIMSCLLHCTGRKIIDQSYRSENPGKFLESISKHFFKLGIPLTEEREKRILNCPKENKTHIFSIYWIWLNIKKILLIFNNNPNPWWKRRNSNRFADLTQMNHLRTLT